MIQFQENVWTEGQAEGTTDGQKDRSTDKLYFTGSFPLPSGVQVTHTLALNLCASRAASKLQIFNQIFIQV